MLAGLVGLVIGMSVSSGWVWSGRSVGRGDTCKEHVFSGEAGEALLKIDGLGDRDG